LCSSLIAHQATPHLKQAFANNRSDQSHSDSSNSFVRQGSNESNLSAHSSVENSFDIDNDANANHLQAGKRTDAKEKLEQCRVSTILKDCTFI
jgi:hypothetical protein